MANVAGEEVAKILDFGIGKAKSMASQVAGRQSQSELSFSSFTPAYGAPEQWVPKRFGQTGPWTDVWGLALTIVEVIAGRTIIDGDHSAMMGTVLDPTRRPTPRNEGLDVPDAVEAVFQRAMALDPRERYGDAGTFWNELCSALGMRGDGRDASLLPRDARAEGGLVPRVETIEAAARPSGPPSRRGSQAAMAAVSAPPARVPSDLFPAREPASAQHPAVPDLDLAPIPGGAAPALAKTSERPPMYARELDFEDAAHHGRKLELEVDLAPDERPSIRAPGGSRPDWPIPPEAAARQRVPSGQIPAVAARSRPDWPAVQEAPRARVASGQMPAAGARRPNSGEFAVTDAPTSNPASSPEWSPPSGIAQPAPPAVAQPAPPAVAQPAASPRPNPSASAPSWAGVPSHGQPSSEPSILKRVLPGAALILLAIGVTVADQVYAASSGEVFTLGPVRSTWIAAFFMLAGVVLIALRLIPKERS
jgi:serine/threonine-protein kinase